jgi:hypothetical protein
MTETEFALLELRLLKGGTPYHVHESRNGKFVCTSPYCTDRFSDEPVAAPNRPGTEHTYRVGEL